MAENPVLARHNRRPVAFLLILLMVASVVPLASGADTDGDGVDDTVDDCPYAAGTSTVDLTGCPDRDGDGTSDLNDAWTSTNPNFSQDFHISGTSAYAVDHNADGHLVAVAHGDRVRIINTSTFTVSVSSPDLVDGQNSYVTGLDWSPDDNYVAATLSDDTAVVMWANNLTVIHDGITHTGSSRTFSDVAFMANSTSFAVVDEASGGWGGGTCSGCSIMLVSVADGQIWREVTPGGNNGEYSSVAFSPDGSHMAVGGDGTAYLIETSGWTTVLGRRARNGHAFVRLVGRRRVVTVTVAVGVVPLGPFVREGIDDAVALVGGVVAVVVAVKVCKQEIDTVEISADRRHDVKPVRMPRSPVDIAAGVLPARLRAGIVSAGQGNTVDQQRG